MFLKRMSCLAIGVILVACMTQSASKAVLWPMSSLTNINGATVEVLGNPKIIDTVYGSAIRFDGDGDRLLVSDNPLAGAEEFTVEIMFKPNDVFPENKEARFFHIESPSNPNRRITIELRLNDQHQWYLDAYIKSDNSFFTLVDPTKVHPVSEWAHAAVTYKNHEFTSYVNGKKELTGQVEYLPIPLNAKTSIGARMNKIHWFNGDILRVRISKKVLRPEEFTLLQKP